MTDQTYQTKVYSKDGGDTLVVASGGVLNIETGGALQVNGVDVTAGAGGSNVAGVAAGYKVARGVHLQVGQSDTIATGLATVVSVVISYQSIPTAKQQYALATPGDQSAAPVAGSFLLKTYKSTLAVADDFTDNLSFDWIAVGT